MLYVYKLVCMYIKSILSDQINDSCHLMILIIFKLGRNTTCTLHIHSPQQIPQLNLYPKNRRNERTLKRYDYDDDDTTDEQTSHTY